MGDRGIDSESRLTGRALELEQLKQVAAELRSGRGRCVFLTGTSGIGKTELAQAFLRHLKAVEPQALTVVLRCVEGLTRQRPYGPFRDLLAELSRAGTDVAELVNREAPNWVSGGPRSPSRNALFDQYGNLLRALTERGTVAVLLDDLQWCDRSSLDLLSYLGSALSSLPILLLVTLEAGVKASAVSVSAVRRQIGSNGAEVSVRPLRDAHIEEVVEASLGGPAGGDLVETIVREALGRPLYVDQVIRFLRERDVIRKRLFRYTVKDENLARGKIEEVVRRRLDTLDPDVRLALEAASFSGSVIDARVVADQMEKTEEEALACLRAAESAFGLLQAVGDASWQDGRRSPRFAFRHPLVRRSLRSRAPGNLQGRLVQRAARALEKLAGDRAGDFADELAALYLSTGDESQTHKWSHAAADLAERLYAPYEAEDYLRSAARTARDDSERTRLEYRLATVYAATAREPEAEQLLDVVVGRCRALEDQATEARAGSLLGWLQLERGVQPAKLSALTGRLVDSARQCGEAQALITATDLACVVAEGIGRPEEALMMGEEAMHVADQSGATELVGQAAYRLARVHVSWGNPKEGRSLAERALSVFRELGAERGVIECHDLLGLADFRDGDWDGALHHWDTALEALEESGASPEKVTMQLNIAELATLRGDFERAQKLFDSGLQMAQKIKAEPLALRSRVGLSRMEFERGDYGAVLEMTDRIREVMPDSGAWREDFQTTAIRALSHLEHGDELQAWREAARLEQLFQGKAGWFERRAEGDAVRIRVIDLDSDTWLAGMVARQGIGETADKDPYGEGFLQYHQACVQARGNPAAARKAAERAIQLFSELGAHPMLGRAQRLLAELPASASTAEEQADEDEVTDEKLDKWFDSIDG